MKKRKALILTAAALLVAAVIWLAWGNTALTVTEYTVADDAIPDAFHGFRIAQIADLHNASFGEGNAKLLNLLRESQPDIIVFTGDLVDRRHTDIDLALSFVREAVKIAPCYFVTGNHEAMLQSYPQLEQGLLEAGVTVLHGDFAELCRDGQCIRLIGVDDYKVFSGKDGEARVAQMVAQLEEIPTDGFDILLQHRPELASRFDEFPVELILSGHAHGGQIRLPFLGGVYAPDQGFWPEYDSGVYPMTDRTLVVSRGLGNSIFPLRVNNRPELVIVILSTE